MILKVLNTDGVPDSTGETFDPTGIDLGSRVVLVRYAFKDDPESCIGMAKLEQRPDGVYADVSITKDIPEHALAFLTPAIGGAVLERDGKVIKKCKITCIGLDPGPNSDKRIECIAKQLAP